jgi:ADP-ribose pyrophosphatase
MMKILNIDKLTDEKWVNLFAATYQHNDHHGRWIFASRNQAPALKTSHCDAVLMVAILRDDGKPPRFVMIREFRVPVGDFVYGLPAGLLEMGEKIEDTVRREMREETGFEVAAIKRVTSPLYSSSGLTDETAALAFIDVRSTPESKQALEGSEDIEVLLLDFPEACALCNDQTKRFDAKAWHALYSYVQLGKFV